MNRRNPSSLVKKSQSSKGRAKAARVLTATFGAYPFFSWQSWMIAVKGWGYQLVVEECIGEVIYLNFRFFRCNVPKCIEKYANMPMTLILIGQLLLWQSLHIKTKYQVIKMVCLNCLGKTPRSWYSPENQHVP